MSGTDRRPTLKLYVVRCLLTVLIAAIAGHGQGAANLFEVSGVVLDPSGAVVAQARVILRGREGRPEQSKTTDQEGRFRFARLERGDYEIEVRKEGFKPGITHLTLGAKQVAPLRIVLPIAELHEEVTINSDRVNTSPDENLNVTKLDGETMKNLPVLGNDVVASLANLLDAGSIGSGGATVLIDGLERPGKKVPASRIQEVRINQNPYSAEFARPGRGRIEIITKPGDPEYHGEFNFTFRDYHLDARNAFARERPAEQRRIFEGNLTGPVGDGKKTTFLFAVEREEEDLQSIVFARTPAGAVAENVASPVRDTEVSFRINRQPDKDTTFSIRYEVTFESAGNEGVGGFDLAEVATNSTERDHEIYFTHRKILSATLVNELTLRAGRENGSTLSARAGIPRIIVLDAFTGGGAQADRRTTDYEFQLNEILSWNRGKHFIKTGLNIPAFHRRALADRTNFGGTFSFSTLEDFLNNRPFLFSVNEGDGDLVYWQKEFGLFVQDNIVLRPDLSIALGLRYDRQNHLDDNNNFAPRLSFAYAPDKKRKTVLRGGAGLFYDRTGGGPVSDLLRFDGQRLRQVTITDPGYPEPFSRGGTAATEPSSIVRFAPDLRSPYTFQFNLGVERQLAKSLTATANYINTRGLKLFRSRNLNAPSPPSFIEPPDPTVGVLRQIESSARAQSHALELMLRGRISRFFNGVIQYNLGRAYNSAAGIYSFPANNFDLTGEWSRAEFDERHRFNLLGTIEAGDWFNLGLRLSLASGRPYSLTTGRDDNRDSVANDRPVGVRRNSLQGPGSATLDVRWAKEFRLKKSGGGDEGPAITISVDAFNVLNRTNYAGFVGNLSSPFFGLPVAAHPARRVELGFGFEF